jgi:hypothetical protein
MKKKFFRPIYLLPPFLVLGVLYQNFTDGTIRVATDNNSHDGPVPTKRNCTTIGSVAIRPGKETVLPSGHYKLIADCEYKTKIQILDSDVTLDCNGATLQGNDQKLWAAIIIGSEDTARYAGDVIKNITIKNCDIRNYQYKDEEGKPQGFGVIVKNQMSKEVRFAHNKKIARLPLNSPTIKKLYDDFRDHSPKNVVLENISVRNVGRSGVLISSFVTGVKMNKLNIQDASNSGLYIGPGSQHNIVENSEIKKSGREGLALDSCSKNIVKDSRFIDNKSGGVTLFKNCWEDQVLDDHWYPLEKDLAYFEGFPRMESADDNQIIGNNFQQMPFGIWIAWRQSKDLRKFGCGDASPYPHKVPEGLVSLAEEAGIKWRFNGSPSNMDSMFFEDFAKGNLVKGNSFNGTVKRGIIVEDDNNIIEKNLFTGSNIYVDVGTPFRSKYLNHSVKGTVLRNNGVRPASAGTWNANFRARWNSSFAQNSNNGKTACKIGDNDFLLHGESEKFYFDKKNGQCKSEERVCKNGVLAGTASKLVCK